MLSLFYVFSPMVILCRFMHPGELLKFMYFLFSYCTAHVCAAFSKKLITSNISCLLLPILIILLVLTSDFRDIPLTATVNRV